MKTKTKILPTGVVVTQKKQGNAIRIQVDTKAIKNKVSKMNLFFQIVTIFLFSLATLGISGFSIMWFQDLLIHHKGEAFILFPFIVGINLLVVLLIIHGSRAFRQDFFNG